MALKECFSNSEYFMWVSWQVCQSSIVIGTNNLSAVFHIDYKYDLGSRINILPCQFKSLTYIISSGDLYCSLSGWIRRVLEAGFFPENGLKHFQAFEQIS